MSLWDPKSSLDEIGAGRAEKKRSVRVADTIRNELATLLIQKVRDPQLSDVAISRVVVTDDLKYAKIYYTVGKRAKAQKLAAKGLERAKGFMRTHIARTLNLRYTPALQFFYDETAEKVEEVEELFREIAREREANEDT